MAGNHSKTYFQVHLSHFDSPIKPNQKRGYIKRQTKIYRIYQPINIKLCLVNNEVKEIGWA